MITVDDVSFVVHGQTPVGVPVVGEADGSLGVVYQLLQQIDVSCTELDELTSLAMKNGAYGAKLTGAGRGGNFIVLCKDLLHASSLKSIYKNMGVHVIL